MEIGLTGQIGVPAVLHAAVEPNSAVALAPILLRLMVERSAVGTGPSLKGAMTTLADVSNRKQNIRISCYVLVRSRSMQSTKK